MADLDDDLHATEESIHHDAAHVQALEEEKAALSPGDPRITQLSQAVERLAVGLLAKASAERQLAEESTPG